MKEKNSKFNLRPWWNDFYPHANGKKIYGSNKETSSLWHHEMKIYFIVNFQTWNRFVGTFDIQKIPTELLLMSSFVLYFFHCMEINHEMKLTKRKLADFSRKKEKKIKLNLFLCFRKKSQFQIPGKIKNFQKSIFHFSKLCGWDECERHLVIFYSIIPSFIFMDYWHITCSSVHYTMTQNGLRVLR